MLALRNLFLNLRLYTPLHRSFLKTSQTTRTNRHEILEQIQRARFPSEYVNICKELSFDSSFRKDSEIWRALYSKLDKCLDSITPYQMASLASSLSKSDHGVYLPTLEKKILESLNFFKNDQIALIIIAYGKQAKGNEEFWNRFGRKFMDNPTQKPVLFINAVFYLIKNDKDFLKYEEHIIDLLKQKEIDSQGVASLINASSSTGSEKLFSYMLELFPDYINSMKDIDFMISLHSISKILKSFEIKPVISNRIMSMKNLTGTESVYLLNALYNFQYEDQKVLEYVQILLNANLKELSTRELFNAFHYISSFSSPLRYEIFIERALEEILTRKDLINDLKGLSSAFHALRKLNWNPICLLNYINEDVLKAFTAEQFSVFLYSVHKHLPNDHYLIPLLKKYALLKSHQMHAKHLVNLGYVMICDNYFDVAFWEEFLPCFNKWKDEHILTEDNEISFVSQLVQINTKLRDYKLVD